MATIDARRGRRGSEPRLEPPTPAATRRRRLPRNATVLMVAAGALTALAVLLLTAERGPAHRALAATVDLSAGTTLEAGMFRPVELRADPEVAAGLVPADRAGELTGQVAANSLRRGELLAVGDVRPPGADGQPLAMALPVPPERAVGGRLSAGDRIDVLRVAGGEAVWVARDLRVLAVGGAGGSGVVRGWQLTVAVDEADARALAEGLAAGEVTVIRSTGAHQPAGAGGG